MKTRFSVPSLLAFAAACLVSPQANATIIAAQAEDAALGSDIIIGSDPAALGGSFIDVAANTLPPVPSSIATFNLDIPAGTYDLYARVLVGPAGGSDDSFFVSNAFGAPPAVIPSLVVNQLGAFNPGFYIDADGNTINGTIAGGLGNEIYHWINITDNAVVGNDAAGTTFTTTGGTEIFTIATRESGLRIDAIAFGLADTDFTSAELTAATIPEPSTVALGALASCVLGSAATRRRR